MKSGSLHYFTQPEILQVVGHRRLARLLNQFDADLKASNLLLPDPSRENANYFSELAAILALPQRLPASLRNALFIIEAAAAPQNEGRLWFAIKKRIPQISVSWDCALDRTLDLWFLAPDEFPQLVAPARLDETECRPNSDEDGSNDSPTPFSNGSTAYPPNASTKPPQKGSKIQELNDSTTRAPTDKPPIPADIPVHPCPSVVAPIPLPLSDDSTTQAPTDKPPIPADIRVDPCLSVVAPIPPSPPETDQQAFARLGSLPPAQYDRLRHAEAQRLQIRLETLDAEVAEARTELGYDAEARAVKLPPVEPWPEPVDGCEVLHQVRARFEGAVILPPGASQILALWPAHAHAFDAFLHTPRLNLTSAVAECGKTTTLDLLATPAPRSLRTENLTAPVLFRLVARHQPTLLLDEVDTYFTFSQELRGLINAGHKQGGCAYRCEGKDNAVRAFNAFAPVVISGIGPLHETLRSRSIRLILLKANEQEQAELTARFDSRHTEVEAILCRKLARWAHDNFAALQACDPPMPPGAYNRVADNWRPLFAIAYIAGGDWPQLALEAYHHLAHQPSTALRVDLPNPQPSTINSQPLDGPAVELLAAIRQIFTQSGATRISSKQLVDALRTRPDARYANLGTPHAALSWLARELQRFGITSRVMRIGTRCAKGYDLADFTAAFARFLGS
jgi:putative DNA primase/helicase